MSEWSISSKAISHCFEALGDLSIRELIPRQIDAVDWQRIERIWISFSFLRRSRGHYNCGISTSHSQLRWLLISGTGHDDVIKWKHFPRNWAFVRGIHRSRWRRRGGWLYRVLIGVTSQANGKVVILTMISEEISSKKHFRFSVSKINATILLSLV